MGNLASAVYTESIQTPRSNATLTLQSSPSTFHFFTKLPAEIQLQVFAIHASFSILHTGDIKGPPGHYSTIFSVQTDPGKVVLRMRSPCVAWQCQTIHLPQGLKVNRLARDATLAAIRKAPRTREDSVSHCRDVELVDFRG